MRTVWINDRIPTNGSYAFVCRDVLFSLHRIYQDLCRQHCRSFWRCCLYWYVAELSARRALLLQRQRSRNCALWSFWPAFFKFLQCLTQTDRQWAFLRYDNVLWYDFTALMIRETWFRSWFSTGELQAKIMPLMSGCSHDRVKTKLATSFACVSWNPSFDPVVQSTVTNCGNSSRYPDQFHRLHPLDTSTV